MTHSPSCAFLCCASPLSRDAPQKARANPTAALCASHFRFAFFSALSASRTRKFSCASGESPFSLRRVEQRAGFQTGAALGAAASLELLSSLESPSSSWPQLARASEAVAAARHDGAQRAEMVAVSVSPTRGNVGPPRAARRRRLALRSAQPRRSSFCRRSSRSSRGRVRLWRRHGMIVLGAQTWSQSALFPHEAASSRALVVSTATRDEKTSVVFDRGHCRSRVGVSVVSALPLT